MRCSELLNHAHLQLYVNVTEQGVEATQKRC
jgi:hypothetical protein